METLRAVALAVAVASWASGAPAQSNGLFAQSLQAALQKESRADAAISSRVSWLLLDARTGQLLASQWPDAGQPLPVGSLTKPFVALAYARTHRDYPRYTCAGASTRCWLPKGHGALSLSQALAFSCNSYFLNLAEETVPAAIRRVSLEYDLPPPHGAAAAEWIGLDSAWRISPLALARAYARLATQPESHTVLAGMHSAAASGTASALSAEDALAKTGTAHCLTNCLANGDGFVVALTPQESPRLLLLVRERGTTGATTATVAARMLHRLREDHVLEP
jgi:hypothetical protein